MIIDRVLTSDLSMAAQHQPNLDAETKPLFIILFPWICLSLSALFVAIFYHGCLGRVSRFLFPGSGTKKTGGEYTYLDHNDIDKSEGESESESDGGSENGGESGDEDLDISFVYVPVP
jgi:hypothetical protein